MRHAELIAEIDKLRSTPGSLRGSAHYGALERLAESAGVPRVTRACLPRLQYEVRRLARLSAPVP